MDDIVGSPAFIDGRIVAPFGCPPHLVNRNGDGQTRGQRIWHEGLFIPLLVPVRAGEMNGRM